MSCCEVASRSVDFEIARILCAKARRLLRSRLPSRLRSTQPSGDTYNAWLSGFSSNLASARFAVAAVSAVATSSRLLRH